MLRDLKIPSQTLEAQLYCTQCAAVGMETSTTDETSTVVPAHYRTQAIFAMSNLSAACKPVLSSQFPPRYREKKSTLPGSSIVMEPSLTPLLCKESSPGT